jgi:hypothetical protein
MTALLFSALAGVGLFAVMALETAAEKDPLPKGIPVDQVGADGGMDYGEPAETETVELSACCRAKVGSQVVRSVTWQDEDDIADVCTACGLVNCDVVDFIRNLDDGTLTDPETGETGLEETPGAPYEDGPDPDLERDRRMDR